MHNHASSHEDHSLTSALQEEEIHVFLLGLLRLVAAEVVRMMNHNVPSLQGGDQGNTDGASD